MKTPHINNKRGPKKKVWKNVEAFNIENQKNVAPKKIQNAINYILQCSDKLMWKVLNEPQKPNNPHLWHAYGLRDACEILERFLFEQSNDYKNDIKLIKEKPCEF